MAADEGPGLSKPVTLVHLVLSLQMGQRVLFTLPTSRQYMHRIRAGDLCRAGLRRVVGCGPGGIRAGLRRDVGRGPGGIRAVPRASARPKRLIAVGPGGGERGLGHWGPVCSEDQGEEAPDTNTLSSTADIPGPPCNHFAGLFRIPL